ncbi:MAG: glutamine synthetase [Acidobacteria bacterium]|nr:glutamine synthetase [Acidobacteriota bacterium]
MTNQDIMQSLKDKDTRWVRIIWCDNANIIRGKAFHIHTLADHLTDGIGISVAQQAVPVMADAVVPETGISAVGEIWLRPDWGTLRFPPYAPGHACVIGDMYDGAQPWKLCPRHFLRRMIRRAAEFDLEIHLAFENEFYLLREGALGPESVDRTVFAEIASFDINREVIDDITDALLRQDIQPERYYPESGPGQQEITTTYQPAALAADRQLTYRMTVRGVAARHGLKASFLPKIFPDTAGNGCHLHLSLWRNGLNILPDEATPGELSATGRAFIAGLLAHLPALMAITTPSPNSYRRIRPHMWSGAFRAWGWDNREAAIRVPTNPKPPSPTHLEFKTSDASANPYLAVGAVIAAGLDGIRQGLDPGRPVMVDPADLSNQEQRTLGVDLLPTNLAEAVQRLSGDPVLREALGPELADVFMAIRRAEWEVMKDVDIEQEVKLLLERY